MLVQSLCPHSQRNKGRKESPHAHRIAISGSAGTGKTTLAKALAARLQVPYLEEGFRKRREAGLDPHDLSQAEHRVLLMELYEEAIAAAAGCNGGFIQDRCPLDFLAFWLHYGFWREDADSAAFYARVQKDLDQYDHVIVLPWGTFDITADSIRSTNRWLQLKYQVLFEGLAHRLAPDGKLLWMPVEPTGKAERLAYVVDTLGLAQ